MNFKQWFPLAFVFLPAAVSASVQNDVYHYDPEIVELQGATTLEPLKTLGRTLYSWRSEIARMFRFTKTNGITEGFHTKMEMLSRRAYGFRNFENYRMRVLTLCGWNGVINRT